MSNTMKRTFIVVALLLAFVACEKAPFITLEGPSSIEVDDAFKGTITFSTNRDWTISSSDSWLSVQPSKGVASEGPVTVTVVGVANTTYEDRTATLTITAVEVTQTVTVKQTANIGVIVPKDVYEVNCYSQSIEVETQANVQFVINVSAEWIKLVETKALSQKNLIFSIQENPTYDIRDGIVELAKPDGSVIKSFRIRQFGRIPVSYIELDRTNLRMRERQTETLVATIKPDDATDRDIVWKTSDASVATVDDEGRVTAVKEGTAVITAQVGNKSVTCEVSVTQEGNIVFSDPAMKSILIERFDQDGDGELSYDEADAVTSFSGIGTHPEVTSFDEFRYFYGLTYIPNNCFSDWTGLTSIVFPDNIEQIGHHAFYWCNSLSSVTLSKNLEKIGSCAFEECKGLPSITITDKVESIGGGAFSRCLGLTSITLPDYLLEIKDHAFFDCPSLTSIVIPDTVNEIGNGAFESCTSLTDIKLPRSMSEILPAVFCGCSSLSSISIPDNVATIGSSAFYGCSSLTSIKLPEIVEDIGSYAFKGCTGLTSISLPKNLTYLGWETFMNCTGLTSIKLPESVTEIGKSSFEGCTSLTSVILPSRTAIITNSLFKGCTSLSSITLPSSVTEIENHAFEGCKALTSIELGQYAQVIGSYAFENCISLASVTIADGTSPLLIDINAFSGCSSLASITLPDRISEIRECAFWKCTSLASAILPKGLTNIGFRTFCGCTSLASIVIPESVTRIETAAFSGCSSLKQVTIPQKVSYLGGVCFCECTGLEAIFMLCPEPPELDGSSVFDFTKECPIYVPSGCGAKYKAAKNWKDLAGRIVEQLLKWRISLQDNVVFF